MLPVNKQTLLEMKQKSILLYPRLGAAIFNHHAKSPNLAGDRDRTNDN
jgi:hypothetical protein